MADPIPRWSREGVAQLGLQTSLYDSVIGLDGATTTPFESNGRGSGVSAVERPRLAPGSSSDLRYLAAVHHSFTAIGSMSTAPLPPGRSCSVHG